MGSLPSGHPLWEQKLYSVVRVCAGRAIAVVAQRARTAHALFPQFSLLKTLTIRFMVVLLMSYSDFHFWLLAGLWHDQEGRVARKRAAGGYHLDFSAAGGGGYGGGDFGT